MFICVLRNAREVCDYDDDVDFAFLCLSLSFASVKSVQSKVSDVRILCGQKEIKRRDEMIKFPFRSRHTPTNPEIYCIRRSNAEQKFWMSSLKIKSLSRLNEKNNGLGLECHFLHRSIFNGKNFQCKEWCKMSPGFREYISASVLTTSAMPASIISEIKSNCNRLKKFYVIFRVVHSTLFEMKR